MAGDTRAQILDVALDLFTDRGYDQTSLREIAEHLGITKAALYYHFSSKDEIFMALHTRMHETLDGTVTGLEGLPASASTWIELFDSFVDKVPANRKLLLMHERNRAVFDRMHSEAHAKEHADIEGKLAGAMADPTIPARQRIRIACAFSMIMGGMMLGGEVFGDLASEELVQEMKSAFRSLLDWS